MVNSPEFAKRLQKILHFYGLSATSFSEKIDFNRSTISHLLSGRNKPSLEFVMKVLRQFPEVELYWLLNGTGSFPTSTSEIKNNLVVNVEEDSASYTENSKQPVKIKSIPPSSNSSEIEKIIIFYKDGSFKAYE